MHNIYHCHCSPCPDSNLAAFSNTDDASRPDGCGRHESDPLPFVIHELNWHSYVWKVYTTTDTIDLIGCPFDFNYYITKSFRIDFEMIVEFLSLRGLVVLHRTTVQRRQFIGQH